MSYRSSWLSLYALIFLCPMSYGQEERFSLEEAISYGIDKNKQIRLTQLNVEDAKAQIKEYWAIGLPKLNGSVQYQHFVQLPISLVPAEFFGGMPGQFAEVQFGTSNSLAAQAQLNALLFDGSFIVGLKAQEMYKELRQKEVIQAEVEVRKNITTAYLNALILEELKVVLEKDIENLKDNLAEVKANYEAGFVEQLDVDRLQYSLQALETQYQATSGNAIVAENLLKFQMNYPMEDTLILSDRMDEIFTETKIGDVQQKNGVRFDQRIEYQIAQKGLELNEVDIRRLRASYLPSLTGFASHSQTLQRNDLFNSEEVDWLPATIVGLNLDIPIFDGFDRKAKIQRAKISKEKTLQQIDQLEELISMEVANAEITLENANQNWRRAEANQELAKKIYDTAQIKFSSGLGSTLEVRTAEQDYNAARRALINAKYDLVSAYVEWQKALGTL